MPNDPTPSERLENLGITLPDVPAPAASYLPAKRSGTFVYTAGQLPFVAGELSLTGKVGADVSEADAFAAARICALNATAAAASVVGGIDGISGVLKVTGFVASAPGFNGQPKVINGASEVLADIFGDAGRHARSAVGTSELPLDTPVEVEVIFEVRSGS